MPRPPTQGNCFSQWLATSKGGWKIAPKEGKGLKLFFRAIRGLDSSHGTNTKTKNKNKRKWQVWNQRVEGNQKSGPLPPSPPFEKKFAKTCCQKKRPTSRTLTEEPPLPAPPQRKGPGPHTPPPLRWSNLPLAQCHRLISRDPNHCVRPKPPTGTLTQPL